MKASLIERKIVQNFLSLENSFLNTKNEYSLLKKNKKYFLGFRKGVYIVDLEKSILIYFKVLKLLRCFQKGGLKTLFIGCPKHLKHIVSKTLSNSDISEAQIKWSCDGLLDKTSLSENIHLAIAFDTNSLLKYCLQKNIPIVGVGTDFNTNVVDFPILINANSISTFGLLLYLIKHSIKNFYK